MTETIDTLLQEKLKSSALKTVRYGVTNRMFASNNKKFIEACKRANIPPTARQASKFRNKKGTAYKGREI